MSKLAAVSIFALCCVSSFAANFQLKTVNEKFRNAFIESNDSELHGLHFPEEDRKFYNALKSLISSQETEALDSSLAGLFEQHSRGVEEADKILNNLNEQLSVVSKLLASNANEKELNENSHILLTTLTKTVNFIKYRQLKPISFSDIFFRQNIQFYSTMKSLGEKLYKIRGNSSLGHNFVKMFETHGDYKLFEFRDQLIAAGRSKRSTKKVIRVIGKWACKFLEIATKYGRFEKPIADYIYTKVPDEYKTEILNTLTYQGIMAVTNLARKLCGQEMIVDLLALAQVPGIEENKHSLLESRNIFKIYDDLFPKKEVEFEFFITFIHWYRLSLENAFASIQTEVDDIASQMKQDIRKVTQEMSNAGNEVLMVYIDDLKMDQYLKNSIRFRAIDLKNTLNF